MRIAFRADASPRMGTGHVVRCRTLAGILRARGAEVTFLCRPDPSLRGLLEDHGFAVRRLPARAETPEPGATAHAAWLGTSRARDAEETRLALDGWRPDWLVVDHYALDHTWESRLRPDAARLLVLDDLADRPHDCDALLDVSRQSDDTAYAALLPAHARRLQGLSFALLDPLYARLRAEQPGRDGRLERVLLYFGGADAGGHSATWLEAIAGLEGRSWSLDLVLGSADLRAPALRAKAVGMPGVHVHENLPNLAPLMTGAQLAIGAPAGAALERCCLGLPSLHQICAENQRPVSRLFSAHRAHLLVPETERDPARLRDLLRRVERHPRLLRSIGHRAARLLDGLGANRVAEHLLTPAGT